MAKNVAALTTNYLSVNESIEVLESKVRCAIATQDDLVNLSTSDDTMTDEQINEAEADLKHKIREIEEIEDRLSQDKRVKKEIELKFQNSLFMTQEQIGAAEKKLEEMKLVLKAMKVQADM